MNTYKIIRKEVQGQRDMVYLYVGYREKGGKKPRIKSIKISVPKKYVLGNANDVKGISLSLPQKHLNGFNSIEELNNYIQEQKLKHQKNLHIPDNQEKIFSDWVKGYISTLLNQGTKIRYTNVLNLLIEYTKYKHERDFILFKEIDKSFILDFERWLIIEKRNSQTTTNYKLKAFKALINHSIKDDYYNYSIHPFQNKKLINNPKINDILTLDELKTLMRINFKEVYRRAGQRGAEFKETRLKNKRYKPKHTLNQIRNYFIFQVLAQGLRLSDLLSLRWKNFYSQDGELYIKKKMVKTQKDIQIIVNEQALLILSEQLNIEPEKRTYYYSVLASSNDIIQKACEPCGVLPHARYLLYELNEENLKKIRAKYEETLKLSIIKTQKIDKLMSKYYEAIAEQEKKHKIEERTRVIELTKELINEKAIKNPLDFVFPILDSKAFYELKRDEDFYTMNANLYRRFQSGRTYYNQLLKIIASQAGINKRLSSHIARHSYSSILLDIGESINLFDIMTSLGHTRLSTTQTYLQSLSNKKLINISKVISSKF
jgi:integrase